MLESQQYNYILNLALLTLFTGYSEDTSYHLLYFRNKTKNINKVSFYRLYWCYIRVISRLYQGSNTAINIKEPAIGSRRGIY